MYIAIHSSLDFEFEVWAYMDFEFEVWAYIFKV